MKLVLILVDCDANTDKKLDKDIEKDLGDVVEAYQEVARRLGILHEQINNKTNQISKPTAVKIKKIMKIKVQYLKMVS